MMPDTLDQWRAYLAESLAPLMSLTAKPEQRQFAKYQTGGRILAMCEHLETEQWTALLLEYGVTPELKQEYVACFTVEVREIVRRKRIHEQ